MIFLGLNSEQQFAVSRYGPEIACNIGFDPVYGFSEILHCAEYLVAVVNSGFVCVYAVFLCLGLFENLFFLVKLGKFVGKLCEKFAFGVGVD